MRNRIQLAALMGMVSGVDPRPRERLRELEDTPLEDTPLPVPPPQMEVSVRSEPVRMESRSRQEQRRLGREAAKRGRRTR